MSIIDRLQTLIRAEIGALGTQRGPSPEHVRGTLREAGSALTEVRANERRLDARYQDLLDRAARLDADAAAAARGGDDARAHRILIEREQVDDEADRVRAELDEHRRRLGELRGALYELQEKARSRSRSAPSQPPPLDGEAFDRLDELESRIADMEADNDLASLDPLYDPDAARVDQEFRELGARRALDQIDAAADPGSALDRLRRRMNDERDG